MFDANLDTLMWSLKKARCESVKVIVGEIGWPTDGNAKANATMAEKFYKGFLQKMAAKKGTPMHPGQIDSYLFSLTDENMKSVAPGDFERHWGIFTYDGRPKFPIDFTGQGRHNDGGSLPVGAKNVQYLPAQWCVLDDNAKDLSTLGSNIQYACSLSDCTVLRPGSSCQNLDAKSRASYAFNMYYQVNNQDVEACDFQGLAKIVRRNASTSDCLFPIALQSGGLRICSTIWVEAIIIAHIFLLFAFF